MNMKTTPEQARDFAQSLWGSGAPDDEVDMVRGLADQVEALTMANKDLIDWFDALKIDHDAISVDYKKLAAAATKVMNSLTMETRDLMGKKGFAAIVNSISELKSAGVE